MVPNRQTGRNNTHRSIPETKVLITFPFVKLAGDPPRSAVVLMPVIRALHRLKYLNLDPQVFGALQRGPSPSS